AAVVVSAVPEDVATVAFHAAAIIFNADNGDTVVGCWILKHVLPAASIDTLEAKIDAVAGQRLVALQAHPLCRHSALGLQESLVAADLHVGNAVDPNFKRTLAVATTAGDVGVE